MRVPALVVADDTLMAAIRTDASLEQIANGATLPGIVKAALAMPDIHQGYGLPVGGVVATDAESGGVVSPGAIGFDINCGVRLLRTGLDAADVMPRVPALVEALYRAVPTGVGAKSMVSLTDGAFFKSSWRMERTMRAIWSARLALTSGTLVSTISFSRSMSG